MPMLKRQSGEPVNARVRGWMTVGLLAVLAACGNPPGESNAATASPQPPAPATVESPAQPEGQPAMPEATTDAAAAQPQPAGVQETTRGAPGGEIQLASAAEPAASTQWRFQEGRDFKVLTAAQGTTASPDKIEVTEAFWYGCSHCYQFDPMLENWTKKLPDDVAFTRLPVMWNPTNQIHARLYYTALALGKAEEMHTAVFREIHVNNNMLTTEEEIQKFFAKFGVSAEEFQKAFRSFTVEGQLRRAKELTQRYEVRSVPLMIVNGKFNTDAPGLKNFDDILAVTLELTERERRR
jgi:thiol:disulfide interchange protein DsbA